MQPDFFHWSGIQNVQAATITKYERVCGFKTEMHFLLEVHDHPSMLMLMRAPLLICKLQITNKIVFFDSSHGLT